LRLVSRGVKAEQRTIPGIWNLGLGFAAGFTQREDGAADAALNTQ